MTDNAACTELIQHHHYANERRRSMYRVNPRPPLRQLKTTQHVHSQPQTIITTMKDDAPCTESTPNHHYHNENDTACTESTPDPHCDIERRHIIYRVDPRPPLRQWKTTQHVQSQLQTTITTMKDDAGCVESTQTAITTKKDDTACTESTIDQHYDNERQRSMYLVNTRPPLRQWKTTQHVQSQSQTTITTRKDHTSCTQSTYSIPDHHSDNERRHTRYRVNHKTPLRLWRRRHTRYRVNTACTGSTPKHDYDNERRRSMYRVNPKTPLRQWKRHSMYRVNPNPHCDIERRHTIYRVDPRPPLRQRKKTQHVQCQAQTTITMIKDDAARTESIPGHNYENEIRHSMYRVNPRPPLRQWKTSQHVQSQLQTTITTMKDDATYAESTTDQHYDNERRRIMFRVNPRPTFRHWKTTHHVQSQPQNTITTMKDEAACTESIPDNHYDNERQRNMYRVNPRPPLRQRETTQHVPSQYQTTITPMKDHTSCTQSTYSIPYHHYDNERRHTRYRVNHKTPLRLRKTTQHVQGQLQNTITTMKDDAACTESTPKHHYDNENDTACTESIQTPIATLKDDTPYTEWIPDHHYDNERRLSMYRVKRRPL